MASFSRILAVDLGATAVRLLEIGADPKGRPSVLALSEEKVPFDPAKTSDFFPIYAQALGTALGRLGSKTRSCHLCMGGPAVFSRILKVPASDPGKVGSMVGFEAQQTVPAIDQALWDYQILPSAQPGEVEALILAIKKDAVEEMSAAASSVGLRPQGVTLVPAALLNAFYFNYPESSGCTLILEIGARATTILLVEEGKLFVRIVPLGGGAVTQAVATDLQESFAGAELLKMAKGFVHPGGAYEDPPDAATARISKLARGVMTRLFTEVERSMTFFRSQQGGGKPSQIWLAGGGASLGLIELFFREKLRIPVGYLQPFRRFGLVPGVENLMPAQTFPSWAVAAGTALQACSDLPVRINVLGAVGRAQAEKRKDRPAMVIAGFSMGALLFLPGIHGFWQSEKIGQQLAGESARVEEATQALDKLEAENKKLTELLQQFESMLSFEQERTRWPGLLEELRKQSPKGLWITSLKVLPPAVDGLAPSAQGKAPKPPVPVVEIGGMFETRSEVADAEAVAKFQQALSQGGVLTNIKILEREAPQYLDGKTDQVALKFRLQADWHHQAPDKAAPAAGGS